MKNHTGLPLAALTGLALVAVHSASAAVMYHDFGATDSGEASTGNITTHQIGSTSSVAQDLTVKNLIDYADGSSTGVTFQITMEGNAMDGRNAGETSPPDAGTPADPLFNVTGLNLNNGLLFAGNPDKGGGNTPQMTFTLGGLDSGLLYDLAFYGNRNASADGAEQFLLGGADSSTNSSSTGVISATETRLDTRDNQETNGHVIRWTEINPGADGEITMTMNTDWDGSGTNLGYLNAMRVEAIPEPSAALLGSLGLLALMRRRR